jgi:hypothetical protein
LEARIEEPRTALAQGLEALLKYLQGHTFLSSIALETLLDMMHQKQIVWFATANPASFPEYCQSLIQVLFSAPSHDEPLDAQNKFSCLAANNSTSGITKWKI